MQQLAFDERITHQDPQFYDLRVKRDNCLYFKFFLVWSMWVNVGRVYLQSLFFLEFGVILDSNLISRILKDLNLSMAPKQRIKSMSFTFNQNKPIENSTQLLLKPQAQSNLDEFNQLDEETQNGLLQTIHGLASGDTLSEMQELKPTLKPFAKLKQLGSRLKQWHVRDADIFDAVGIALDEKVIKKAFDAKRHRNLSNHWVSRVKTYLPSLIVEVAALVRPGRLAEVVGHFFPYPQKYYDHRNRRKPMKKHIYLKDFLDALFAKFGKLVLLADANYSTQKLITWLVNKGWHFVMRVNPNQRYLLKPLQARFDSDPKLKFISIWQYSEKFGGFIRVLAYRRFWKDAKGTKKQKRYFLITTLDWDAKSIWRFYRLRWTLENTFKCLPILDRTPGLNPDLIAGFFALVFYTLAPVCYQSRSSSRTIAKLLDIPLKIEKNKVSWQNLPTRFARKLLLIGYYRSMEISEIRIDY